MINTKTLKASKMSSKNMSQSLKASKVVDFLTNYGAIIGMLAVLLILQLLEPRFLKIQNIVGILNSSSVLVMLSIAMMMTMSVKGVNLSVAQTADAAGIIVAMLILQDQPVWVAVLGALGFGLLVGVINGLLMAYLGIPAIIGTLGMMFAIRSFELIITNGAQPQILFSLPAAKTDSFFFIGQGQIGPIPFLIVLVVAVTVIFFFLKERSTLGRKMDAIWGNARAAKLASIDIRKVFGAAFVLSCVLAAVAGVVLTARTGNAVPRGAETYLMDTFVACYLGMLMSKNNKLNVFGTALGALYVSFLSNWFTLMSLGAPYKNLFNGLFIVLAVTIGVIRSKRKQ